MADSTIPDLTAVTTPAGTDEFSVRQSGDTRDKKETRAQIHSLVSGEHLILPQVNEPATPTFAFGDGDSGFYEDVDESIRVAIGGNAKYEFDNTFMGPVAAQGGVLRASNATATLPVIVFRGDQDTGLGRRTDDIGVLIAGAKNCMEFGEAAAAPLIGFYGTAAIGLQTGVAVTAAGVHAALVNLGLITA